MHRPSNQPLGRLRRIGLTGGIGAGKSTVAALWAASSVPVIDLDALSRAVLDTPGDGVEEAVETFGESYRAPTGTIDRAAMAALVFADAQARARLETIVLTRVEAEVRAREAALVLEGCTAVVHDSPLLLEKRSDAQFDVIVAVLARREERIRRVMEDRGHTREYVESIMAAQVTDLERARRADLLIANTSDRGALERRSSAALACALAGRSALERIGFSAEGQRR